MRKQPNTAPQPKFPPVRKKCKYCHVMFMTPPTYNGQQQEFCIPAHRKAFHKEGRKPILAILKRQEKHMRKIAREEARAVFEQIAAETRSALLQATEPDERFRYQPQSGNQIPPERQRQLRRDLGYPE